MTFKYSVTLPISGSHKLSRFRAWANEHLPGMSYCLPPQTPIKTETMTIKLRSMDDRATILQTLSKSPLA